MRFVIIGAGPAGVEAAAVASRLGAEVILIEKKVLGGMANLYDCVPSKAMIATGGAITRSWRSKDLGLIGKILTPDLAAIRSRILAIANDLTESIEEQLLSQGVTIYKGEGRLLDPHSVEVTFSDKAKNGVGSSEQKEVITADAILLATGSYPRVPDWAEVDGDRIMLTRHAYPPQVVPEHMVVVGSGVTGVEFVHMFRSLGSKVTLIVSRQQVLPGKDPEVAAALEEDFLESGVTLIKGARANGSFIEGDKVTVTCEDGRKIGGSHVLIAIGSIPASSGLGLENAGIVTYGSGYVQVNHHCQTNLSHIYAAGDLSGRLQLASVAQSQGRKIAEHAMGLHTREHRHIDYDKAASAIFTEPEIADVGLAEAEAFAQGRKIRVTKVPFSRNAKAMIDGDPRGFVKLLSDPHTGVILGGSIVGAHAAELISVIAVAVTCRLRVDDIQEALFVHPALAEAISAAAE